MNHVIKEGENRAVFLLANQFSAFFILISEFYKLLDYMKIGFLKKKKSFLFSKNDCY